MAVGVMTKRVSVQQETADLVHEYMGLLGTKAVDLAEAAEWAVKTRRYQKKPLTLVQQCQRDMARALRSEYIRDPQGRDVRRMHAARMPAESGRQMVLWAELFQAPPAHIRISMQQRRQGILADAKHHKLEVESYNDNNVHGAQLEMFDYNFNADLDELKLPTTYPAERPDDDPEFDD